jgi:pimeloyl-ACP methyl ester carboxylesterase
MSHKAQLHHQHPHWWRRMLRSLGLALGISVVLLTVMGMAFGDRFIFFPSRANEEWDRHRRVTGAEEVTFPAADGAQLVSWYLRATSPRATVLFFHGNAGNLSHRTDILQTLTHLDADVLIVGYHGYGKSAGEPSEANLYLDADAAYAYLTEQRGVPPSRLVVFGESLGGGPAIDLASRKPCAGLIVQSSFIPHGLVDTVKVRQPGEDPTGRRAKTLLCHTDGRGGAIQADAAALRCGGRAEDVGRVRRLRPQRPLLEEAPRVGRSRAQVPRRRGAAALVLRTAIAPACMAVIIPARRAACVECTVRRLGVREPCCASRMAAGSESASMAGALQTCGPTLHAMAHCAHCQPCRYGEHA